jgi:hypothetical protein
VEPKLQALQVLQIAEAAEAEDQFFLEETTQAVVE